MKNKHYAAIYSLITISVALVVAYFCGAFTVRVSILDLLVEDDVQALTADHLISEIDYSASKLESRCTVLSQPENSYCGLMLKMFEQDSPSIGMDLSGFDSFNIGITPKHTFKDPRVKITFKHFSPVFSTLDDPISTKYNSVLLDLDKPSSSENTSGAPIYNVPFEYFQVDLWWINNYGISVHDAQVDLSNIVQIEFINRKVEQTGQYDFEITAFEAVGERLTLTQVFVFYFTPCCYCHIFAH